MSVVDEDTARAVNAGRETIGGVLSEAEIGTLIGFLEYGSYALPPVPDDAWYLQNLATTEAARGRGIGDEL